ncbi:hypothetical protein [Amaricoccus sp.]|uniref:hypothetical protein n=1 Tax=Amaricoccus sp. TaxID=1872485 RepID=UPI0026204F7D|nr:hypothetical protein [Amaricoccus sp.]HRO13073.1 hypothetical protein [Amaricoccus sp.]
MPRRLVCCAVLALTAGAATAQELAPEGSFVINFTAVGVDPEPAIEIGPDRSMGIYEGLMTASNSDGHGLLHNLTGRCLGWFTVDIAAASFERHGRCAYTDTDGDTIWEEFTFAPQALAPVRIALGRWTGGTGKYEGIRGEFEIRVRGLRPAAAGFGHYIGTKQGSYRTVRSH